MQQMLNCDSHLNETEITVKACLLIMPQINNNYDL